MYNIQGMEPSCISIKDMDKTIAVFICNEILFALKEGNLLVCET
jgi:hypothetical protein